jgi:hypothetical protein
MVYDPSGKRHSQDVMNWLSAYEMNFTLIKRKFEIKDGSYILWTGEPTAADINITVYKWSCPIDLVNDQLEVLQTLFETLTSKKSVWNRALKMNMIWWNQHQFWYLSDGKSIVSRWSYNRQQSN